MNDLKNIGIFGGTFAPVHNGHISAAYAFFEQCKLDKLFIMPTSTPPHKQIGYADNPTARYEMLLLVFGSSPEDKITVSDYEIKRQGKSYTVNTLRHFKQIYGGELYFLCGADMFVTLDTWIEFEEIFKLAHIAYIRRGDINVKQREQYFQSRYNARITEVVMPAVELSSTKVREKIAAGADVSSVIPAAVQDYIREHGLYRSNT